MNEVNINCSSECKSKTICLRFLSGICCRHFVAIANDPWVMRMHFGNLRTFVHFSYLALTATHRRCAYCRWDSPLEIFRSSEQINNWRKNGLNSLHCTWTFWQQLKRQRYEFTLESYFSVGLCGATTSFRWNRFFWLTIQDWMNTRRIHRAIYDSHAPADDRRMVLSIVCAFDAKYWNCRISTDRDASTGMALSGSVGGGVRSSARTSREPPKEV